MVVTGVLGCISGDGGDGELGVLRCLSWRGVGGELGVLWCGR